MTENIHLSPADAKARIEAGALLIDVREPDEYTEARIAGALLIPMSELNQRLHEFPRDREVVVYCRSGNRSAQVVEVMRAQLGYTNLYNLQGGIIAWYRQSLPIDTSPVEGVYHRAQYEDIDIAEAQRRMANGAIVVDVRELYEYTAGHLPGAINIPFNTLPRRFAELKDAGALLVVCATGNRSAMAADWLLRQGMTHVANIEGGTVAWLRHGLPIER